MNEIALANVIAEGKTKIIFEMPDVPGSVGVRAKCDITAGDGRRHDILDRKGVWATRTTCAVFELLKSAGIPVAYEKRLGPVEFQARRCRMLPFEIVTRIRAAGSYLERNPSTRSMRLFDGSPIVEFYLKTSGGRFTGVTVPCDDPYIAAWYPDGVVVVDAHKPPTLEESMLIPAPLLWGEVEPIPSAVLEDLALRSTIILEKAWHRLACELIDVKIECGLDTDGRLLIADVIDPDSWRLLDSDGNHLDKQPYREGAPLDEVARIYRRVAELSERLART